MLNRSWTQLAATLLVLSGAGCGDDPAPNGAGGAGGSGGQPRALQILETTPDDMATEVDTDLTLTAAFDAALDAATVSSTSFTVAPTGGEAVNATADLTDAQTASLSPDRPLALLTEHMATVTTQIKGLEGESLKSDFTWTFTTADGRWRTPELVENNDEGDAIGAAVTIDGQGNTIVVWRQNDGIRENVWANRHVPGEGWGEAERIEASNAGNAGYPEVVADSQGNAVAVFHISDGTRNNIWANRYTTDGGWGVAELIEGDDAGNALNPKVAIDGDGNAIAVWYQSDGARDNIRANRFTQAGSWGVAEPIETTDAGDARNPRIAMNADGTAIAGWSRFQSDGNSSDARANRYTPTGGWGTAVTINSATPYAGSPSVAVDPDGNAIAVWQQEDINFERFDVWASRFTATGSWGAPEAIETDDGTVIGGVDVTVDPFGNAIAVWQQQDGIRNNIWANRYAPTSGWDVPERIEANNAGGAGAPRVAIDANGNALTVWQQSNGTRFDIWANRYLPEDGWGIAELVETDDAGDAREAAVAMGPNGAAVAVWTQENGLVGNISASHFE